MIADIPFKLYREKENHVILPFLQDATLIFALLYFYSFHALE
jgi:putative effector of murein hydrolase